MPAVRGWYIFPVSVEQVTSCELLLLAGNMFLYNTVVCAE